MGKAKRKKESNKKYLEMIKRLEEEEEERRRQKRERRSRTETQIKREEEKKTEEEVKEGRNNPMVPLFSAFKKENRTYRFETGTDKQSLFEGGEKLEAIAETDEEEESDGTERKEYINLKAPLEDIKEADEEEESDGTETKRYVRQGKTADGLQPATMKDVKLRDEALDDPGFTEQDLTYQLYDPKAQKKKYDEIRVYDYKAKTHKQGKDGKMVPLSEKELKKELKKEAEGRSLRRTERRRRRIEDAAARWAYNDLIDANRVTMRTHKEAQERAEAQANIKEDIEDVKPKRQKSADDIVPFGRLRLSLGAPDGAEGSVAGKSGIGEARRKKELDEKARKEKEDEAKREEEAKKERVARQRQTYLKNVKKSFQKGAATKRRARTTDDFDTAERPMATARAYTPTSREEGGKRWDLAKQEILGDDTFYSKETGKKRRDKEKAEAELERQANEIKERAIREWQEKKVAMEKAAKEKAEQEEKQRQERERNNAKQKQTDARSRQQINQFKEALNTDVLYTEMPQKLATADDIQTVERPQLTLGENLGADPSGIIAGRGKERKLSEEGRERTRRTENARRVSDIKKRYRILFDEGEENANPENEQEEDNDDSVELINFQQEQGDRKFEDVITDKMREAMRFDISLVVNANDEEFVERLSQYMEFARLVTSLDYDIGFELWDETPAYEKTKRMYLKWKKAIYDATDTYVKKRIELITNEVYQAGSFAKAKNEGEKLLKKATVLKNDDRDFFKNAMVMALMNENKPTMVMFNRMRQVDKLSKSLKKKLPALQRIWAKMAEGQQPPQPQNGGQQQNEGQNPPQNRNEGPQPQQNRNEGLQPPQNQENGGVQPPVNQDEDDGGEFQLIINGVPLVDGRQENPPQNRNGEPQPRQNQIENLENIHVDRPPQQQEPPQNQNEGEFEMIHNFVDGLFRQGGQNPPPQQPVVNVKKEIEDNKPLVEKVPPLIQKMDQLIDPNAEKLDHLLNELEVQPKNFYRRKKKKAEEEEPKLENEQENDGNKPPQQENEPPKQENKPPENDQLLDPNAEKLDHLLNELEVQPKNFYRRKKKKAEEEEPKLENEQENDGNKPPQQENEPPKQENKPPKQEDEKETVKNNEEEKRRLEEEKRRQEEERNRLKLLEEQRKKEEEKRRIEEEEKRRQEEERARLRLLEEQRKKEEEEQRKKEEEEKLKKEEEEKRKKEEEEKRKKEEEEKRKKEEEEKRKKEEEEKRRKEEEEKRKKEEEKRKKEEEKRKKEEEERRKKEAQKRKKGGKKDKEDKTLDEQLKQMEENLDKKPIKEEDLINEKYEEEDWEKEVLKYNQEDEDDEEMKDLNAQLEAAAKATRDAFESIKNQVLAAYQSSRRMLAAGRYDAFIKLIDNASSQRVTAKKGAEQIAAVLSHARSDAAEDGKDGAAAVAGRAVEMFLTDFLNGLIEEFLAEDRPELAVTVQDAVAKRLSRPDSKLYQAFFAAAGKK